MAVRLVKPLGSEEDGVNAEHANGASASKSSSTKLTNHSTLDHPITDAFSRLPLPTVEFGNKVVSVKEHDGSVEYTSGDVQILNRRARPWWKALSRADFEPLVHEADADLGPRDRAAAQVLFLAEEFSAFLRDKLGIDGITDATGGCDVVLPEPGQRVRSHWNHKKRIFLGSNGGDLEVGPEALAHEYGHGILRHLGVTNPEVNEGFADSLAEYFCYWLAHRYEEARKYFDWQILGLGEHGADAARSFRTGRAAGDVERGLVRGNYDPHRSAGAVRMLFFGLAEGLAAGAEPFSAAYDRAMDSAFAILFSAVKALEADDDILGCMPQAVIERAEGAMSEEQQRTFTRDCVDRARDCIRDIKVFFVLGR